MEEKIVSSYEVNRIKKINNIKNLVLTKHLEDENNPLTKFLLKQFYGGKKENLDLLKLTYALPFKITNIKSSYTGKPDTNLKIKNFSRWVKSLIYGGYCIFVIFKDKQLNPYIEYFPPERYIKNGNQEIIITNLEKTEGNIRKKYTLLQIFTPGKIENKLYESSTGEDSIVGKNVPLNTLEKTKNLAEVEETNIDINPIVKVDDNLLGDENYGMSQLKVLIPLFTSLDIALNNIQDQHLKHLHAKLAISGLNMQTDKDGKINIRDSEVILQNPGSNKPEYISNKNDLIKHASDTIDCYVKQIASNISVPLELVGLTGQVGNESLESKEARFSDFIRDIEDLQDKFKEAFMEIDEIMKKINPKLDNKENEFKCIFPDVLPKNKKILAEELAVARNSGFISLETAVAAYTDFTGEKLEQELEKIKSEDLSILENNLI